MGSNETPESHQRQGLRIKYIIKRLGERIKKRKISGQEARRLCQSVQATKEEVDAKTSECAKKGSSILTVQKNSKQHE